MGVWGLPAELVLVPVPQGATQEHACGQIRCCSPDLLFLEGTLMGGVLYNDLCETVLSSAGGWDPSEDSCGCAHPVSTPSVFLPPSRGRECPEGCFSIPALWVEQAF